MQVFLSFHIYKTYDCSVLAASYEEVWSESQTKESIWLTRYWAGFLACCCECGLGWRCLQTSGRGKCKWLSAWKQCVCWWSAPEKLLVVCVQQCMSLTRSEDWWWRVESTTAGSWRGRRTSLWSSEECYTWWWKVALIISEEWWWRVMSTPAGSWRSRRTTCGVLKDAIMVVESGPHKIRRVVVKSGEYYGWFMEEQEDQLVEFRRML